MEKLYTPQEIADQLQIKKHTVYELIKRGELQSSKIGKQLRVSTKQLEQYIKSSSSNEVYPTPLSSPSFAENSLLKHEYLKHSTGLIVCGQDPALDLLCSCIEAHPTGLPTLRSYMGSYNALYALYFDKVHIATAHLWNGANHSYNLSYIHHLMPGVECVVIHLFKRQQGFYVQKGNPKNITSFKDLVRSDIRFINREKGSGTRILLDEHLKQLHLPSTQINGYETEVLSHITCATKVASGDADVSIGQENTLEKFPMLEFIPIQLEHYDLVFKKEALKHTVYQAIIDIIQSGSFKTQLSYLKGYDITETGKIIYF